MIIVKIIADSISPNETRLTTFELEYPRYIHAQLMTHRMFSRNAQSSRAIPTHKLIDKINSTPLEIDWAKNKRGMQAGDEIKDHQRMNNYWNRAKAVSKSSAQDLSNDCVHKQWANRLLEPFSTIKVICTATEYDNFFKLRLEDKAQPEIQRLAQEMDKALDSSNPRILTPGQWHLPYVDKEAVGDLRLAKQISVARCARVSYLTHDNEINFERDLELYHDLLRSKHMSPFEHQATPMKTPEIANYISFNEWGVTHVDSNKQYWSGNFKGWVQHRHLLW